jgi:hypothetical protein
MKESCLRLRHIPVLLSISSMCLSGCAYRLLAPNPPSRQTIRLLTSTPQDYSLRVESGNNAGAQAVGSDGRVTLTVPSLPRGCDVYLFNAIKVRSAESALDHKAIQIVRGPDIVKKLSLNDVAKLPQDSEGYRLLRIPN